MIPEFSSAVAARSDTVRKTQVRIRLAVGVLGLRTDLRMTSAPHLTWILFVWLSTTRHVFAPRKAYNS